MTVKAGTKKPSKPHKDFPLYAHASGQWAKTVRGKKYFFGAWDDPDEALRRYRAEIDGILAGINRETQSATPTVGTLVNSFLNSKEKQCEAGELSQRTFNDYHRVCAALVEFFGKPRRLETIGPDDFTLMRSQFPDTWGPTSINNRIRDVSTVFKFAYDVDAIDRRINTGPNFKRVSKKRQRLHRQGNATVREFTATEVHQLIAASPAQLKAMIYLGLNAGFGPADCGRLQIAEIDFDGAWLSGLREKTAVGRAAWLWPETLDAIRDAIEARPPSRKPEWDALAFLTSHRRPWYVDGDNSSPIQQAFKKAAEAAGCYRKGVGHYVLRHMLEKHGGTDQPAINCVMGHSDGSMAELYREIGKDRGVARKRVKKVCQTVRKWFLAGKPEVES
ncbi:MAG: site-specific integrase [Planctomycetota bacterium]